MRWLRLVVGLMLVVTAAEARGFRTGQTDCTVGTAVKIGNENARTVLNVKNQDTTNPIFFGDSSVTSSTGVRIEAGTGFTLAGAGWETGPPAEASTYCVATGSTVHVSWLEVVR